MIASTAASTSAGGSGVSAGGRPRPGSETPVMPRVLQRTAHVPIPVSKRSMSWDASGAAGRDLDLEFAEKRAVRLMWCSRGCLGTPAISDAWLCHVSIVGGARRRGCAAGGVPVFFRGLLEESELLRLAGGHERDLRLGHHELGLGLGFGLVG